MLSLVKTLPTLWSLAWGIGWVLLLHPLWRRSAARRNKWVIGGHRGRLYGDNPAAVEAEARRQGKDVVWIANQALAEGLRAQGLTVLVRQSWSARRAISRASLLIYSHGEDDLDILLVLLRGRTAPRAYLGHSLSLLKAGGVTEPSLKSAPWPLRAIRTWLITRWDYVLCASEEELLNFKTCYPDNRFKDGPWHSGGGAHLDEWRQGLDEPSVKRLYWFPTFRDTPAGTRKLRETIAAVVGSAPLRTWLLENGYEFYLGTHVNDGTRSMSLEPPFFAGDLRSLVTDVRQSEVLISDYSGVVFDFLLLERPPILFAFDLEDYQHGRQLYGDYNGLDFAAHARTTEELLDLILEKKWLDPHLTQAAQRRRALSLPAATESYAARSVLALDEIETSHVAHG